MFCFVSRHNLLQNRKLLSEQKYHFYKTFFIKWCDVYHEPLRNFKVK